MIASYFSGRLGNQLFRYAYVRALWEERGRNDTLVFNFRRTIGGDGDGFEDALQHFRTLPYNTDNRSLVMHHGTWRQKALYARYRLVEKMMRMLSSKRDVLTDYCSALLARDMVIQGSGDNGLPAVWPTGERVFVNGFFENRAYFDHIRPILLKELQPRHAPLQDNAALYEAIAQRESVCVSVRRGDYLSAVYSKGFYVCDEAYFQRAIDAIKKRVHDPLFVFFSDDIDWVRTHLKVPEGSLFERGDDPVWEKLRLMSSCKHFIISNSSFSWWAQYLGQHAEKLVVSPVRWFNEPSWTSHLIDDSFIKV